MRDRVTDPETIQRWIAEHGRWWHRIELFPGIVTPGDDSNQMKLPILDALTPAHDSSLAGVSRRFAQWRLHELLRKRTRGR